MTASSPMAYCLAEGGKTKQMNVDEKRIAESIKPLKIKYTIFNSIVAILAIGCFGWLLPISTLSDNPKITMVVFFVSMSIILIFSIPARKTKKEYLKGYKQLITRPVMEALFDEVYYYPDMGYSLEQFRKTGLIPWKQKPSYYVSDNLIRGTYNGVKFKQCDIEIRLNDEDTTKDIKGSLIEFSLAAERRDSFLEVSVGGRGSIEFLFEFSKTLAAFLKSLLDGSNVGLDFFFLPRCFSCAGDGKDIFETFDLVHARRDFADEFEELVAVVHSGYKFGACCLILRLCLFKFLLVGTTGEH